MDCPNEWMNCCLACADGWSGADVGVFVGRFTVRDLLQHNFFQEDSGFRVEQVNREDDDAASCSADIQLQLRVVDAKKRSQKNKENEAIQFDFNIEHDQVEEVVLDLVSDGGWIALTGCLCRC